MTTHAFRQVDVFADGAFTGNPLAVVHDADDVGTDSMQSFTTWTNLSEAAFLLAPTDSSADYRVRIFEPKAELPFAGHPTLGACAAWLDAGGVPHRNDVIVQECGAGLIEIKRTSGGLAFGAPPMIRHEPVESADLDRAMSLLGLTSADVLASHWIDNGPGWMGLLLRDAQRVLDVEVPTAPAHDFDVGIVGLHRARGHSGSDMTDRPAIEVRAFFNNVSGSIREDPVTGSLNASIAQWLTGAGWIEAPYTASQTTGLVHVDVDLDVDGGAEAGSGAAPRIWVGGGTAIRISGLVDL